MTVQHASLTEHVNSLTQSAERESHTGVVPHPGEETSADRAHELSGTTLLDHFPPFPHPFRHPLRAAAWCVRFLFGVVSIIVLLAVIAAVPVLNLIALGYLLDAEGGVARSGKLRAAFPLWRIAPRFGAIALGIWLWLLPLRLLADAASDARLIDPGAPAERVLQVCLFVAAILVAAHLCLALARGGKLSCFFRPIKNGRWFAQRMRERDYWNYADRGVREFIGELRPRYYFWLGMRGFLGAAVWLALPTAIFAAAPKPDGAAVGVTLIGGLLLAMVLSWLPFLQAHFAAQRRLRAMFELKTIREYYRRAPVAWCLATLVVYALALPLYLFKIALPPSDAMWGITLVFILSIFPAKVLVGWVYHRASSKPRHARWWTKWLGRALIVPTVLLFVFVLYFTQFIGEHGKAVLFEQHALLLPVPF